MILFKKKIVKAYTLELILEYLQPLFPVTVYSQLKRLSSFKYLLFRIILNPSIILASPEGTLPLNSAETSRLV